MNWTSTARPCTQPNAAVPSPACCGAMRRTGVRSSARGVIRHWGVKDPYTGACHLGLNQCKKWGGKFFNPAVAKAALRPEFASIAGATPYSLRRGGISVRLRAEDAQTVASECGTSLQMLDKHYAFAIDDLRRFGPRPFNLEWQAARTQRRPPEEPPRLRLVA